MISDSEIEFRARLVGISFDELVEYLLRTLTRAKAFSYEGSGLGHWACPLTLCKLDSNSYGIIYSHLNQAHSYGEVLRAACYYAGCKPKRKRNPFEVKLVKFRSDALRPWTFKELRPAAA